MAVMFLIDTHTHLDGFFGRGELPAVLKRARVAGVGAMIAIGTDADDWSLYRDLARDNGGSVHYSVGLHPGSVDETWEARFDQIEDFWLHDPRPVALGEVGLDRFHLPKEDKAAADRILGWQKAAFAAGLGLAKKLDCPIVVHSREAFGECVEMIDESGVDWRKVVFHCFTEGVAEIDKLRERGGFASFTGVITYKSADIVRAAALKQGLDRLMIETDAPYLTPMPHRGKPNEPAFVRLTAEYCATLFEVSYEELTQRTTANAKRFFAI